MKTSTKSAGITESLAKPDRGHIPMRLTADPTEVRARALEVGMQAKARARKPT